MTFFLTNKIKQRREIKKKDFVCCIKFHGSRKYTKCLYDTVAILKFLFFNLFVIKSAVLKTCLYAFER